MRYASNEGQGSMFRPASLTLMVGSGLLAVPDLLASERRRSGATVLVRRLSR